MVKKSASKHISHNKTHILLKKSLAIYAFLVFLAFILISLSALAVSNVREAYVNQQRYNKIVAVYEKINLDQSYSKVRTNIFGDKRVYAWDNDRTESSSVEGGHNDTPANTIASISAKILAAGFTQAGSAYEDSASPQYYFKNNDGVYVRLQVTSATVQNQLLYATQQGDFSDNAAIESAPTYYVLKVNLDDNNE